MPSIFAQGFWQRLGRAVLSVATGAAENYVGSTLNDNDRKVWNEISNDINNGLGLDNNYVNAGNKLQEGKTTDAVVNMGVTAASNSGNQTLITVSKTVQAQNDYVNNVSSGMDQKTAQDVAAKQISEVWLDDMGARERIAAEKRRNEYDSSNNTYTTSSSTSSDTQYSALSSSESNVSSNTQLSTPVKYNREALDALSQRIEEMKQDHATGIFYRFFGDIHHTAAMPKTGDLVGMMCSLRAGDTQLIPMSPTEMLMDSLYESDIYAALRMMHVGDSASFIFDGPEFFRHFMKDIVYPFGNDPLYFDVKLYGLIPAAQFQQMSSDYEKKMLQERETDH